MRIIERKEDEASAIAFSNEYGISIKCCKTYYIRDDGSYEKVIYYLTDPRGVEHVMEEVYRKDKNLTDKVMVNDKTYNSVYEAEQYIVAIMGYK
jgi:hypothetical protein